jgi:predicted nucleic acid-binding protein
MTGLDFNILVQLFLLDHPTNARTVAVVQAEVRNGSRLVLPPLVINEFLQVITDQRRFSPPPTLVLSVTSRLERVCE